MEKTKKRKNKGLIIGIVVLLILAGIIGAIVAGSRALSQSIEQLSAGFTELTEVEMKDISDYISVSGQVESENLVKITSTLTAKVRTVYVDIGSEVKAGDVLLEFDSDDIQNQYDTLKKSLDNAENLSAHSHQINERNLQDARQDKQTALAQAQRAINAAISERDKAYAKERDYQERVTAQQAVVDDLNAQLLALSVPAEIDEEREEDETSAPGPDAVMQKALLEQLQEAKMTLSNLQSSLDVLREQLPSYDAAVQSAKDAYAQAESSADRMIRSCQDVLDNEQFTAENSAETELKKLEEMLRDCTVRAPKSGLVTSLNVAEGSLPTSEALMTIENKDALKITVSIAEADILRIKEGMKAVVKTTATGDEEFNATVTRVVNIYRPGETNMLGRSVGEGGYSAEITIDDKNTDLLIGMNAKVKIILSEKTDVMAVPYEAIVEEEDGSFHVLRAETDDKGVTIARAVKVTPGMEGSYFTEITSDELKPGDRIVMSGANFKDGDVLLVMPNMNDLNGEGADKAADDE